MLATNTTLCIWILFRIVYTQNRNDTYTSNEYHEQVSSFRYLLFTEMQLQQKKATHNFVKFSNNEFNDQRHEYIIEKKFDTVLSLWSMRWTIMLPIMNEWMSDGSFFFRSCNTRMVVGSIKIINKIHDWNRVKS